MNLTVLVPGIRTANWLKLYNSIETSFTKGTWEIIFIGPEPPTKEVADKPNVVFIQDWGTPIRCQQIGLVNAKGDYITWAADDGIFLPDMLSKSFILLKSARAESLTTGKYAEGDNLQNQKVMSEWPYYYLAYHNSTKYKYVPKGCMILNVGLVPKQLLIEVGGWDCQFEVCPMSYSDLSARLTNMNVRFIKQEGIMFKCGHMPGHEGDHGPIHDAQIKHDEPLFGKIWSAKESENRMIIDINNWKQSPSRWARRFGCTI